MEYQVASVAPHSNLRRRRISQALWGYLFILPQLIGLLVFALIPLVAVFIYSGTIWDGLGEMEFVGLQNFVEQLNNPDLRIAMVNTLYYTVLTVPVGLTLALLVALGVSKVHGKDFYRALYFLPVVTSSVAIAVLWLWLLNGDFGLINSILSNVFYVEGPNWLTDSRFVIPSIAMVSIWSGLGYNMIIFLAGLQSIPAVYSEAARVDGASRFHLFWRVTLPLLTPTIFFVSVISIIHSFQVFDLVFVLTNGGPGRDSYTIVQHIYRLGFDGSQFGGASASAVLLFFILLSLTLVQFWLQRRWVHYDM